jgi:BlaI family transcriptional regulator, penicillinase repressor
MRRKLRPADRMLTQAELELMAILWSLGEASVAEVMASLPRSRDVAYTTVSTILRILEQKGFVASRKEGRGHLYSPKIRKKAYEARSLKQLVTKVFDGAPSALVRRLLDENALSQDEIDEIQAMLNERIR